MYRMDKAIEARELSWPQLYPVSSELFKRFHRRLHWPVVMIIAVDQESIGQFEP
jgi:hypothetical protein